MWQRRRQSRPHKHSGRKEAGIQRSCTFADTLCNSGPPESSRMTSIRFQQQKAEAIAALPPPHLRLQLKSAASSVVPTARPTHFNVAKTTEKIPDRQTAEHSREYPSVTSTNTSYRCQHSMGIKLWQLEKKPCQESGSSEISRDRASIRSQGQQLPIGRCTSKQTHCT
ncbi:hypothetical protein Nepgr_009387 [Nepenthes gracilis]|uniref:Uncharacterized protein n=1 Tax=Nepenthes gracilis TaxID=150966 RepID=A0AAD3SBA8_NEPGR|nr:hypothetical protein Nepgr_009387 [Nepenthes gracilis]